jgi:GTP-binding protein EngB required for normal cell division
MEDAESAEPVSQNLVRPTAALEALGKRWYDAAERREITLVAVGRYGAGKSTLIRNMLRLEEDTPHAQNEARVYTVMAGDVKVKLIDTPGFGRSDDSDIEILAELQETTEGKADMLLYCVSLLPSSEIDILEKDIVKKLTRVFRYGANIWKHVILVCTFANTVKVHHPQKTVEDLVDEYASKFQLVLQNVVPSFPVASVLQIVAPLFSVVSAFKFDQCSPRTRRDAFTIVALPAGENRDEELVEGMKWDDSIYTEVLNKCNRDFAPSILEVNEYTPRLVRLVAEAGGFAAATVGAGVAGIGLGLFAGAAIGAAVGAVKGLMDETLCLGPGAELGAEVGAILGIVGVGGMVTSLGGMAAGLQIAKYEEEQAEVGKIQEAVERRRS